jgi:hypothetical protein
LADGGWCQKAATIFQFRQRLRLVVFRTINIEMESFSNPIHCLSHNINLKLSQDITREFLRSRQWIVCVQCLDEFHDGWELFGERPSGRRTGIGSPLSKTFFAGKVMLELGWKIFWICI